MTTKLAATNDEFTPKIAQELTYKPFLHKDISQPYVAQSVKGRRAITLYAAIKSDKLAINDVKGQASELAGYEISFQDVGQDEEEVRLPEGIAFKSSQLCPISLAVYFKAKNCFRNIISVCGIRKGMQLPVKVVKDLEAQKREKNFSNMILPLILKN